MGRKDKQAGLPVESKKSKAHEVAAPSAAPEVEVTVSEKACHDDKAVCNASKASGPEEPSDGNSTLSPVQLPVMSDSTGEPLLLYCDDTASAEPRLSAIQAPLRLIFLDVDGVLNNKSHTTSIFASDEATSHVDVLLPECLAELRSALDATCAHIVLSTTWRSDTELRTAIVETLEHMRPGCVVGQTPQDPSYRNDMRPAEIACFLEQPVVAKMMNINNGSWCAVDDMDLLRQADALKKDCKAVRRLLPALHHGFVRTDKEVGLDEEGAKKIQQAFETLSADAGDPRNSSGGSARCTRNKRSGQHAK